jgi:hypothetical protein
LGASGRFGKSVLSGMAKRKKQKAYSDWYGNPVPEDRGIGIVRNSSNIFYIGEVENGKKYIRAYSKGGVPGDRIELEDCFCCIKDDTGIVVYDSRCDPPVGTSIKPDYIGYAREKQLKRYFPG